jgi:hypothetical protein
VVGGANAAAIGADRSVKSANFMSLSFDVFNWWRRAALCEFFCVLASLQAKRRRRIKKFIR